MSSNKNSVKSRKNLEIILEKLEIHPSPEVSLEQYPIDARSAANILFFAGFTNNDIYNKLVLDLGCGTGRLAIGASLLGARNVVGIDIDSTAIEIAVKNAEKAGCGNIQWIVKNISDYNGRADTVIQNPPFGVQNRGNDLKFLKKALELGNIIYSLHKSGKTNRQFLQKNIYEFGKYKVDNIIEMEISILHQFQFHKKKKYEVLVDLWRILKE